jgi:hypothetical protein
MEHHHRIAGAVLAGAFVIVGGCAVGCTSPAPPPADLVLVGPVITMDQERPRAEGLAARDGEVMIVGSEREVRRAIGPDTEVVVLPAGAVAVPGLIEAHGHFLGLGQARSQLDLTPARTWGEIVDMVRIAAETAPPDAWIIGRGWHQEKWDSPPTRTVEGMPLHDDLSAAVADHPVLLTHASGHAALANAMALELAGIGSDTPDPPGGEIVRHPDGRPTGILRETAEELVTAVQDTGRGAAEVRRLAAVATAEALANGITSFQDAGTSLDDLAVLRAMAEEGALGVRLWVMLSDETRALAQALPGVKVRRAGRGFLTVGGIKRWVDGALGSRGAWLLEPYTDAPESSGLAITTAEELRRVGRLALENDLQLCSHAIGDRANRVTLDVYEELLAGTSDRRWRVEHAQHLDPDDLPRFAQLGVIASMQPVHCTSDGPWVEARLGEPRASLESYRWRDLLDSGAVVASGTDTPVEPVDPMATFTAAVTRRMADGRVFVGGQAMTRNEALASMTRDAAWAAFEEDVKGVLSAGRYADVTVLSADPSTIPESRLAEIRVLSTVVAGRVAYPPR